MKNIIILVILLIFKTYVSSQNNARTTIKFSRNVITCNLRSAPDPNSKALLDLKENDTLLILKFEKSFWKVQVQNQIGYVNEIFVVENDSLTQIKEYFKKLEQILLDSLKQIDQIFMDSLKNAEALEQKLAQLKKDSLMNDKLNKLRKRGVPIYFISANVSYNSIGTPEVELIAKNISNKIIDAYTIKVYCYDRFDRPVNHIFNKTNIFTGISQKTIEIGKTNGDEVSKDNFCCGDTWTLYGHDNTSKIKIYLTRVHFINGTQWASPTLDLMTISGKSDN